MEKTRQAEEEQDEVATEPGAAAEPVQAMMAEAALPGQPAEDPMPAEEAPSPTVTPNAGGNPAVDSGTLKSVQSLIKCRDLMGLNINKKEGWRHLRQLLIDLAAKITLD